MTYVIYDKLWRSHFYNNVSAKNGLQNINLNQLKLKVNHNYEKDEKITAGFEPSNDGDIINEAYLDTKLSKLEGQVSFLEKDYTEFKMRNDKHSEEVLIERSVKTAIKILYDKGLFDFYNTAE